MPDQGPGIRQLRRQASPLKRMAAPRHRPARLSRRPQPPCRLRRRRWSRTATCLSPPGGPPAHGSGPPRWPPRSTRTSRRRPRRRPQTRLPRRSSPAPRSCPVTARTASSRLHPTARQPSAASRQLPRYRPHRPPRLRRMMPCRRQHKVIVPPCFQIFCVAGFFVVLNVC